MAKKQEIIEVQDVRAATKTTTITIEGDTDLVLNCMNARTVRQLTRERNDQAKKQEVPNKWEDIITAIHWRDGYGMGDTYQESTVEKLRDMLANNAPCISAFGLKKSFCAAVVRNGIDTYATKFDACLNIVAVNNLVPVEFAEWSLDERLMSPKRGAPVLSRMSHFSGWRADVTINYIDTIYSLEQIVNIINLAGFGLGIGSGRTSGYGRYHISGTK
ncbi:MAG: hypothetical protein LUD78_10925 [Clostridiales bacterium]|nr:hypothetical protein [Clostridiales bacterium]